MSSRKVMRTHYLTSEEGYIALDLLQFGIDHIASAGILLNNDPRCYDSAGYLAHIGFELIFKAIALHSLGRFPKSHDYSELLSKENLGKCYFEIPDSHKPILQKLDLFSELRYPQTRGSASIGSEDWHLVESFYAFIESNLPKELLGVLDMINPGKKGGRVLFEKPKKDHE